MNSVISSKLGCFVETVGFKKILERLLDWFAIFDPDSCSYFVPAFAALKVSLLLTRPTFGRPPAHAGCGFRAEKGFQPTLFVSTIFYSRELFMASFVFSSFYVSTSFILLFSHHLTIFRVRGAGCGVACGRVWWTVLSLRSGSPQDQDLRWENGGIFIWMETPPSHRFIWVFPPKIGVKPPPKWMVYFMENPIKMGWFGGAHPYFWTHLYEKGGWPSIIPWPHRFHGQNSIWRQFLFFKRPHESDEKNHGNLPELLPTVEKIQGCVLGFSTVLCFSFDFVKPNLWPFEI